LVRYRNRRYHAAVDAKNAPMTGEIAKAAMATSSGRGGAVGGFVGGNTTSPLSTRIE
jgi:hypothetical protein